MMAETRALNVGHSFGVRHIAAKCSFGGWVTKLKVSEHLSDGQPAC